MSGLFRYELWSKLLVVFLTTVLSMFVVTNSPAATCGDDPTVTFDVTALDVLAGGSVDYTVSIKNNTAVDCEFVLALSGDSAGFASSLPDGSPFTVTAGATRLTTLSVAADGALNIGTSNTTTLSVDGLAVLAYEVTTTVNNPLLHNSFNLGSDKWSGQGGWGIASGRYGEFSCATCHAKNTGNIKRIVSILPNAPDQSKGNFPGATLPVILNDVTAPDTDFGDDSATHATSARICEVCHTYDLGGDGVKFHAFNMGVTANHENSSDCIGCHAHNTGFAASCSACHGDGGTGKIWPDGIDNNGGRVVYADDQAGAHDNHIAVISQELFNIDEVTLLAQADSTDKQIAICAFCHPDPGGGGHDADGGADSLVDMQPAGSFEMFSVGAGNHTADTSSGAYNFTNASCSNLACHDQKTTPTGAYNWNSDWTTAPPPDCTMCHAANGGTLRHDKHVGGSSFACTECHLVTDNINFDTGTVGVDHVNGDVELYWDNAGSYEKVNGDSNVIYSGDAGYKAYGSGVWGTCDSVACHGNFITPAWDQSGTGCGACHTATKTSGAHEYHMQLDELTDNYDDTGNTSDQNNYDFGCGDCHSGDTHVNGSTTVTTHGFNNTTKTCNNASCHGFMEHDGVTYKTVTTPAWNGPGFVGDRCAGCHGNSPVSAGHEEHQIGFHYDAVYSGFKDFMPVLNSDPKPIGLVNGAILGPIDDPYDTLRGHGGLLTNGEPTSTTMSCYVCHNDTVTARYNDLDPVCGACHNSTDAPLMGTLTIADKSKHINGVRDVVFMREKVRSKAQVRDDIFDVSELSSNWSRMNNYKLPDGSSFDESPDTLFNMSATYGGYNAATMTCMVSCHLWEEGRVDKYPVHWYENSRHNPDLSKHLMCIDCHTRLPK